MRKIIAAIVAGFILGAAGTVTAAPTVQAVFAKFNFVIDGKKVDPGVDPLVYQGTTYLPVRVFSNLLGYDVTYKADSRTIELTSTRNEMPSIERGDTVPSEWIGLRTLAEQYGLTVRQASPQGSVFRVAQGESIWFDITYDKKGEAYATTPDGSSIRVVIQNGSTNISIEDLRSLGLIQ